MRRRLSLSPRSPGRSVPASVGWTLVVLASLLTIGCGTDDEPATTPVDCPVACGDGEIAPLQTLRLGQGGREGLAGARSVAVGPQTVYVAASRSGRVSALDRASLEARDHLDLPGASAVALAGPGCLLGTLEGDVLVVTDSALKPLAQVEGAFRGARSITVAPDGASALVAVADQDLVARVVDEQGWRFDRARDGLEGASCVAQGEHPWVCLSGPGAMVRLVGEAMTPDAVVVHPGLEAVQDAAIADGRVFAVGAAGLWSYRIEGAALVDPKQATPVLPHGVTVGWDDVETIGFDAVAVHAETVVAASWFGGYLVRWPMQSGDFGSAAPLAWQPPSTDDDREVDLRGVVIGRDPTRDTRLVDLHVDDKGIVVASGLWDAVAAVDLEGSGVTVQQGQGGVVGLGGAYSVAPSPDGAHVYVAAWNSPDPAGFRVLPGGLEPLPPVSAAPRRPVDYGTSDVAVASDGAWVYAVDDDVDAVHVYARDPNAGTLTWTQQVGEDAEQELQVAVAVSPDGRSVLSGAFTSGTVARFEQVDGRLTLAQVLRDGEEDVDGLAGLEDLVFADDEVVYAAAFFDSSVTRLRRGPDGALTVAQVTRDPALDGVEAIALSADGLRVLAVSPVHDTVVVLRREASGALNVSRALRWPTDPLGDVVNAHTPNPARIVAAPRSGGGEDVYASLRFWDRVLHFRLSDDDTLTMVDSVVVPGAGAGEDPAMWPNGLALSPDGRRLFTATTLGDTLVTWTRAAAPGMPDGCGGTCPQVVAP